MLSDISMQIWDFAETALHEQKSSALLRQCLADAGFTVLPVANMPTAFLAEYGSGAPVIGLLAEYDALPHLSQAVCAWPEPRPETDNGHGCGHNLICTACLGAALAVKDLIDREKLRGTIRLFGCPAEETASGKAQMIQQGVFDQTDCALTFHPSQLNVVVRASYLASTSIQFHFTGKAAHAAAAPEQGRSALDAVELMNIGANYLREHIDSSARLHYCITNGGDSPNTVPAEATVWYMIRAPKRAQVQEVLRRLHLISQGAAMMTETTVHHTLLSCCCDVIPNMVLSEVLDRNMASAGGPVFSQADRDFAAALAANFSPVQRRNVGAAVFAADQLPPDAVLIDQVYHVHDAGCVKAASTDAGNVSYLIPFAQFNAATWPLGTPPHSWAACAASGSGIGAHAMIFAAKVLAGACQDLLYNPSLLDQARQELLRSTSA